MNRRRFLATTALAASALAAPEEKRWRVAVIGHTGHGDYGHGIDAMWLLMPETEIVGVADADAAGLEKARKKLKGAPGFADYHTMLAEVKPDIVAIGPRHVDEHHDMALAAIGAGARGIYSEKPLCRTLAEADEIIAACAKSGTRYAVAHRNRYHPALATVAALLKAETLGRVLDMRARGKEDQRGGAQDLWVLGSHVLNLSFYFAGAPRACSALLLQDGKPATHADVREGAEGVGPIAGNEVQARFETERGLPVFFTSIAQAGNSAAGFGVQIIGTKGVIDLRADRDPLAQVRLGSPFQPDKELRAWQPITTAGIGQPEPIADLGKTVMSHVTAGRDLLAAIGEKRAPLCSAEEARTTLEAIAAIFESHRQEGRRVTLPLASRDNPLARL